MAVQYFYNVDTGEVEEGRRSQGHYLMGPYATREEAAQALQTAREKTEKWDAEDDAWNEEPTPRS